MEFAFTDEQKMIAETVQAFFRENATSERTRQAMAAGAIERFAVQVDGQSFDVTLHFRQEHRGEAAERIVPSAAPAAMTLTAPPSTRRGGGSRTGRAGIGWARRVTAALSRRRCRC